MRALHVRVFMARILLWDDPHSCPSHEIPCSVWLWYGTWVQPTDERKASIGFNQQMKNVRHPLENQYSACTEANQTVERPIPKPCTRIQPTDEERKAIRDYIQKSEALMTMVDLFKHLSHSTRTVATVIVQELEKEGVVRKIEGSGAETDKWEWSHTNVHSLTFEPELYVCMLSAFTLVVRCT